MHLCALGAQHGTGAGDKNGRRGLQKEEGLLGFSVVEFGDVIPGWPAVLVAVVSLAVDGTYA